MLVCSMLIDGEIERYKFEKFYERSCQLMYHIAFNIVKNDMDAENIVHDVFLVIAEKYNERYSSWHEDDLCKLSITITKYKAVDCVRRNKYLSSEELESIVLYDECSDFMPEDYLEKQILKDDIRRILEQMPEVLKIVLELKYYHNLSNKEICKVLDAKPRTIESRLYRAKVLMKELIENEKLK